jgi:hypothetical protein
MKIVFLSFKSCFRPTTHFVYKSINDKANVSKYFISSAINEFAIYGRAEESKRVYPKVTGLSR